MKANYILPAFLLLPTAADAQEALRPATPYSDQDFLAFAGNGDATLHGQAFLKTVEGDVKTCAGTPVFLMPDNPYMEELVAAEDSGAHAAVVDPRALAYRRQATCDSQGNFHFSAVPKGSWYVVASVTWRIPHIEQEGERPGPLASLLLGIGPAPEFDNQGGELRKAVELVSGENEAILTGDDEIIPGVTKVTAKPNKPPVVGRLTSINAPTLGIKILPTPVQMAPLLKVPVNHGLWVITVDKGSAAARAGLSAGDVILTANGKPWDLIEDLTSTMNALHETDRLVLEIWSQYAARTVVVTF